MLNFQKNIVHKNIGKKLCDWRSKIEDELEFDDFLTEKIIKEKWNSTFESVKDLTFIFVPQTKELKELTWNEVFEQSYHPSNYGKEG